MKLLKHPRIVKYIDSNKNTEINLPDGIIDNNFASISMEYAPNKTLFDYLLVERLP